jgi:ferritin-like metal-binding protein YciE
MDSYLEINKTRPGQYRFMKIKRLELMEDMYQRSLEQLYDGEKQMVEAMPKISAAISDPTLRAWLQRHTSETRKQIERLERLLESKKPVITFKAKAISGLLREAMDLLEHGSDADILDEAMAAAAAQIEGHEITAYGCAHQYAKFLGRRADLKPLEESFQEEKRMEERLIGFIQRARAEDAQIEAEGMIAG